MTAFLSNLVRRGVGSTRVGTVRPPYVPQFTPVRLWRPGLPGNGPNAPEPPPLPADHPHEPASTPEKPAPKAPDTVSVPVEKAPSPSLPPIPQHAPDTVTAPRASRTVSASPEEGNSLPRDPKATERPEERTRRAPDAPRVEEPVVFATKVPDPPEISVPPMRESSGPERHPRQHDPSAHPATTLPPPRTSPPQDVSEVNVADIREVPARQSRAVRNGGKEHADHPAFPEDVKAVLAEPLPPSTSLARRAPRGGVIEQTEPVRWPPVRQEAVSVARPVADRGVPPVRLGPTKTGEPTSGESAAVRPDRGPVQVRIGTVEVRASTPPATGHPPGPHGFDGYLAMRTYAGWEGT
jgi:hypothetical protein